MFAKLITTSAILAGVALSSSAQAQSLGDIPKQFSTHPTKSVTHSDTAPTVFETAAWMNLHDTHGVHQGAGVQPRGVAGPVRAERLSTGELYRQAASQEGLSFTVEQIQRTTAR